VERLCAGYLSGRDGWIRVYYAFVTGKSDRIAKLIDPFRGRGLDARYLAFFDLFNRQLFFDAHDVLEELWLAQGKGPNHAFHKGLIQLAGGFVHLQKGRLRPAASVLKLAERNLSGYVPVHDRLDVAGVIGMTQRFLRCLEESQFEANPMADLNMPKIQLLNELD
jgi:predicted metal-dependent hydrolase